jgi:hypothetical protein
MNGTFFLMASQNIYPHHGKINREIRIEGNFHQITADEIPQLNFTS